MFCLLFIIMLLATGQKSKELEKQGMSPTGFSAFLA